MRYAEYNQILENARKKAKPNLEAKKRVERSKIQERNLLIRQRQFGSMIFVPTLAERVLNEINNFFLRKSERELNIIKL